MASTVRSRGFPASACDEDAPRLRRYGLEGDFFHVTATVRRRLPIFTDPRFAKILLNALQFVRKERSYVLAYAIMPDHFHALLLPRQPHTVSQVMQSLKGYSSRRINQIRGESGPLWQQSFFDRIIRDEAHLWAAIDYVERNPVEAGLVEHPDDFLWSSAHKQATTDVEAWLSGLRRG